MNDLVKTITGEFTAKQILVSLALAEHPGDVADDLPRLAELLGLPKPTWVAHRGRFVFPFEATEDVWTDGG